MREPTIMGSMTTDTRSRRVTSDFNSVLLVKEFACGQISDIFVLLTADCNFTYYGQTCLSSHLSIAVTCLMQLLKSPHPPPPPRK